MTSSGLLPALLATVFALQPPGTFHGNEPVARDGERWLALRVDARAAGLVETVLHVRAVDDPVLDAPGERSGREVGSPLGEGGIVMFLRGPGLRAGPVAQAGVVEDGIDAAPVPARAITWRGRRYALDAQCDAVPFADVERQLQHRCRFVLADGDRRQVLLEAVGWREPGLERLVTDASAEVLFAGDLDRDGRLDLIIDLTDHYNVARPTLLLSSQAAAGELVGMAAVYESVGC
jgi:hypothetical protein